MIWDPETINVKFTKAEKEAELIVASGGMVAKLNFTRTSLLITTKLEYKKFPFWIQFQFVSRFSIYVCSVKKITPKIKK